MRVSVVAADAALSSTDDRRRFHRRLTALAAAGLSGMLAACQSVPFTVDPSEASALPRSTALRTLTGLPAAGEEGCEFDHAGLRVLAANPAVAQQIHARWMSEAAAQNAFAAQAAIRLQALDMDVQRAAHAVHRERDADRSGAHGHERSRDPARDRNSSLAEALARLIHARDDAAVELRAAQNSEASARANAAAALARQHGFASYADAGFVVYDLLWLGTLSTRYALPGHLDGCRVHLDTDNAQVLHDVTTALAALGASPQKGVIARLPGDPAAVPAATLRTGPSPVQANAGSVSPR